MTSPIQILEQRHRDNLLVHPKAYFELATGRYYGCMMWMTDESRDQNPNRNILANEGAGSLGEYLLKIAGFDIDSEEMEHPMETLSSIESKDVCDLVILLTELEDNMSYAHMCIAHKGNLDWVIRIDSHHTVGHNQYFPLVRESANSLQELIAKAVVSLKQSEFAKMSICKIPHDADTGVVCHIDAWEATAA